MEQKGLTNSRALFGDASVSEKAGRSGPLPSQQGLVEATVHLFCPFPLISPIPCRIVVVSFADCGYLFHGECENTVPVTEFYNPCPAYQGLVEATPVPLFCPLPFLLPSRIVVASFADCGYLFHGEWENTVPVTGRTP
ncbi:hypothetical protein Bbelb_153570 [Branchiostoma belcheri]|nr:hypothetical protein Bbelb_153570 [Branchiostoma belcheri]